MEQQVIHSPHDLSVSLKAVTGKGEDSVPPRPGTQCLITNRYYLPLIRSGKLSALSGGDSAPTVTGSRSPSGP